MATRKEVYEAIDREREYQDCLGPSRTDGAFKTVGDYITMLGHYHQRAVGGWVKTAGDAAALQEIRKVAAIAVRCLEEHGNPKTIADGRADAVETIAEQVARTNY